MLKIPSTVGRLTAALAAIFWDALKSAFVVNPHLSQMKRLWDFRLDLAI